MLMKGRNGFLNRLKRKPFLHTFATLPSATLTTITATPIQKKDSSGRQWTFIHNGTIFDYAPLNKYVKQQKGETDSERILLYLIDLINEAQRNKNARLSNEERFALLDSVIPNLAKGNKLNFLLSDGKYTYVHTNYAESLRVLEKDGLAIFSTQPLTNENWKPVPFTTLLAYSNGRLAVTGTTHHNEYVDNEESMKFLYQIFSDL